MNPPVFTYRLNLYDSAIVFEIAPRAAGVYKERVSVGGNSILSTLWVKSIDPGASVSARWYDIGPGNDEYPGEQVDLVNHGTITTADVSDRRVASKCHNKAFLEVTVTGGSATFGVYVTVVSSFPSGGLYLEGQSAILTTDGGTGITIYDPSDGKFYLARGEQGVANVNIVGGSIYTGVPGDPFVFKSKIETTGIWQTLISETVPVGKKWRLVSVKFLARCYGEGDILINEISIDNSLTSPAESNVVCAQNPLIEMIAGQKLEVKYKRNFGSNNADINAIATLTTIDV
jgi:hypothetical protein